MVGTAPVCTPGWMDGVGSHRGHPLLASAASSTYRVLLLPASSRPPSDRSSDTSTRPFCLLKIAAIPCHLPGSSAGKEPTCSAGDPGSIPGLGRSPGGGYGDPLQYSCLENPMDRKTWWATAHGVIKSRTGLSDFHFLLYSSPYTCHHPCHLFIYYPLLG